MSTPKFLALIADELEVDAGATSSANLTHAGYWKRIATAAEIISGAVTSANATATGWMKRAAAAIATQTGFTGTGYNQNEGGYIEKIADALEFAVGTTTVGSSEKRLHSAVVSWAGGGLGSASFDETVIKFDGTTHTWDEA